MLKKSNPNCLPILSADRKSVLAILSLMIGILLTFGVILSYFTSLYIALEHNDQVKLIEFNAKHFQLTLGDGVVSPDGVRVTGLDSDEGIARISSRIRPFHAENVEKIHWNINGLNNNSKVDLFWLDQSRGLYGFSLDHRAETEGEVSLENIEEWQGTITTIGFLVKNPLDDPLDIKSLRLQPAIPGPTVFLSQLWQQWIDVEGWQSHSINAVMSGDGVLIRPVPLIALWVTLSLLIYFFWVESIHPYLHSSSVLLMILAGWLVLDLRWQWDITSQIRESVENLHGKSLTEKLMDYDGDIIELSEKVKKILPKEPTRIFLISDFDEAATSARHNRMRYHLVPHNVYGLGLQLPPLDSIQQGDYILMLLPSHNVRYRPDSDNETLLWSDHELPVELLLTDHDSLLFRTRSLP